MLSAYGNTFSHLSKRVWSFLYFRYKHFISAIITSSLFFTVFFKLIVYIVFLTPFADSASDGDQYGFEDILSSIRDLDITPESIREFLPKVNWDQLASLYIPGRSGAECEAR